MLRTGLRLATEGGSQTDVDLAPHRRLAHRTLLAVCGVFAAVSLLFIHPTLALGWDEIVYASRFDSFGPAVEFSAPRTRGVPALLTPVAAFSDSVVLLRLYLTGIAALALYLGYRPWLSLPIPPMVVPIAAAAYGSLWFNLFYAGAAMPNHYVAMGAVATVGCFLHVVRKGDEASRWVLGGLVGALATATLMRPNDTVWLVFPLLLAAICVPAWRQAKLLAAVMGGFTLGCVPWLVESQLEFGGVSQRLADASEIQGGMHPTLSISEHAAALAGPLLCRPCGDASVNWLATSWWFLLPPLVAMGVWGWRRAGKSAMAWLTLGVAFSMAVTYLFLIDYAAPRFLMPTYALLALLVVAGGREILVHPRFRRHRRAAIVVAAVLALAHTGIQGSLLNTHSRIQADARQDWTRIRTVLQEQGVHPPCLLAGNTSTIPIAYTSGCRAADRTKNDGPTPSALVLREQPLPKWASDWTIHRVPDTYNPGWTVAVPK